jgi:hypothetical protein
MNSDLKVFLIFSFILLSVTMTAFSAVPVGGGNRDLFLGSAIGFDRSPCILEWWQFDSQWELYDLRMLRQTNETWTDLAVADFSGNGQMTLITSMDNCSGYSSVVSRPMDEYGSLLSGQSVEILANEPWRHYSGVTVCDLNFDGIQDLVTIASDHSGGEALVWFGFNENGNVSQEVSLVSLVPGTACAVASLQSDTGVDLFVLLEGNPGTGGSVVKYKFDNNMTLISTDTAFFLLSPEMGQAGGVDFSLVRGKPNRVNMVLCTHDWDVDANDPPERCSTTVAYDVDSGFILDVTSIDDVESRLYQSQFAIDEKPTTAILFEQVFARRWVGVAIAPSVFTLNDLLPSQFSQHTLIDSYCGSWGFFPEDLNRDCIVNIADVAELADLWLYCYDPTKTNCDHPWQ